MNPKLPLAPRTFPSRVADLGFTAQLPAGWISHELPPEDVDFSNPVNLMPLGIVTAPHAAIVFAFAARPAYDDGTLLDWATYLLGHNQLQPRAIGRGAVAGVAAVIGEATQPSGLGPMVVRFAFIEDGGRLLNLTLTAPELLADTVVNAWFALLQSFTLETPKGSRFPVGDHPDNAPGPVAPPEGQPAAASERQSSPVITADDAPTSSKKPEFKDFALATDAAALDPGHPVNASLRDRGVGLVPNVAEVREAMGAAIVAPGAILAQITVPFGWHVIDDGKRALVFEPGGQVQISLNLIPRERRSNAKILDEIEAQMRKDYPAPEFLRLKEGRIHALAARNIADGGQPLEQCHMLHPFRDDTMVLRARVTATPERMRGAANLAELILDSCAFDCFQLHDGPRTAEEAAAAGAKSKRKRYQPPPEPDSGSNAPRPAGRTGTADIPKPRATPGPGWWDEALALEADSKLEQAERCILDAVDHLGCAASIAEMYRLRMLRLKAAGDTRGAEAAFRKASDWIWRYASGATSGGEGAALSLERDEFRAQLVREYGSDPEAEG